MVDLVYLVVVIVILEFVLVCLVFKDLYNVEKYINNNVLFVLNINNL